MRTLLVCIVLLLFPFLTHAQAITADERAQLEAQLVVIQKAEAQAQQELATAQSKSSSLANDIAVLTARIKATQLEIKAKNILIKTLGDTIVTKQKSILSLEQKIELEKSLVANLMRGIQFEEKTSLMTHFLSSAHILEYSDSVATYEALQAQLIELIANLSHDEEVHTQEKNVLVAKKDSAVDARYDIQLKQKSIEKDQGELKKLLAISKENEKGYSAVIAAHKKEINAINARLFTLAGGNTPIPFKDAYQYAKTVQAKTGLDPAYLLAVLTQESNLGSNVGTCFLTDPSTGAGTSAKSGRAFNNVMHPTRDVPIFLAILQDLDLTLAQTKVSCPQAIGWGGAMGPAQFIPSTWKQFQNRVASALGKSNANPWNPQDAFMAAGLYLSDLGATGGYSAQSNAACRYYSGSSCSKSSFVASYGTSVMKLANSIQTTEIDKITSTQ